MKNFVIFNNNNKKVIIRADRIVSALEVEHGCFINTDDGGEYDVSETIEQFLSIMNDSSDKVVTNILTSKPDDNYTENQKKLIAACETLSTITGVECGYDISAEVTISNRGSEALEYAKKNDIGKCKRCLDSISEYRMSHDGLVLDSNIKDAIHDAYEAILT